MLLAVSPPALPLLFWRRDPPAEPAPRPILAPGGEGRRRAGREQQWDAGDEVSASKGGAGTWLQLSE